MLPSVFQTPLAQAIAKEFGKRNSEGILKSFPFTPDGIP